MAESLCTPDTMTPCRETLGLMPEGTEVVMYALTALSLLFFVGGFLRKWLIYARGAKAPVFDHPVLRARRVVNRGALQTKILVKKYSGPMHAMLFWGFTLLFIGTALVALETDITLQLFNWEFLRGTFYLGYEFVLDFAGILVLIALGMAFKRRVVDRPEALRSTWQDGAILGSLAIITITGYILEALRLAIREPDWSRFSFVAAALVPVMEFGGEAAQLAAYRILWWTHAGLVFAFVAAIPFTKLHHMLTSPANIFFAPLYEADKPHKGKLPTPFNLQRVLESGATDIKVGALKMVDFDWRQRLSVDACTECGRCQEACPAYAAGRPLSPMRLVLDLRNEMRTRGLSHPAGNGGGTAKTNELVDDVIRAETLWSCVTCRACVQACPVDIDHVPLIVEMRRGLVAESRIDKNMSNLLNNLANTGNAYGFPASERGKWSEGLDVPIIGENGIESTDPYKPLEVLYWVGCSGSYDPRNQKVSRAVVAILKRAGVRFAILGPNERCTGDPARRLGEEGRFQELALGNIEAIRATGARKIIAQCPHCFNTIKNEYGEFGLQIEVEHHTQFIARLIDEGRLPAPKELRASLTYHDSCYLARYNDETEGGRKILRTIPGTEVREMQRVKHNGFCCGAGGSNMWFEVKEEKERISGLRVTEAMATGAERVATACPFCLTMLEDQARVKGGDGGLAVQDVVEILAESLSVPAKSSS